MYATGLGGGGGGEGWKGPVRKCISCGGVDVTVAVKTMQSVQALCTQIVNHVLQFCLKIALRDVWYSVSPRGFGLLKLRYAEVVKEVSH